MTEERRPYNVGAIKIPYEWRDVAHAVITPEDDRGYFNIIGADDSVDSDSAVPLGESVTYRVDLTEEEAERFRAASNCRYVELDTEYHDDIGVISSPAASSMRFMRATFTRADQFHGRDVTIGMLDGGTTAAVRNYLGITMLAKQNFSPDDPGPDEITSEHGCLVVPCLVPQGGKFLDAVVSSNAGTRSASTSAAAARWCADNGAKVINYSGSGAVGNTAWNDMLQYLLDRGVQFFASAGNDGLNQLYYPAALSTQYSNCHSSISFDENTETRSSFSCHDNLASGCAPGSSVLGLSPAGVPVVWSGTSASAPHMALLCAMGLTANRFSATAVGAALKANTRNTGQPAEDQGAGAYSLEAALTALGAFSGLASQAFRRNLNPNPSFEANATGYSGAAVRTGVTAAALARFSTIPTPFGTIYTAINVTGNGTTSTTTPDAELTMPPCPVTGGLPYVFSAHSRYAATVALQMDWQIRWENDAGTSLGVVTGPKSPLFQTVWPRYHIAATAPAGATRAILKLRGWGFTEAVARSWRFDGFQYEQAASLGSYFDGSNGAWDGTVNNSTSTVGTAVVEPPPDPDPDPGPGPGPGPGQGPPPDPNNPPPPPPEPEIPKRVPDEVMRVLQGTKGIREWRFRFELLTAENIRIRDLDNVLGGSIAHDFFAEVKRTGKFTLRDDGSINFLTQRIRPYVGILMPDGTWKEWSQGVFLMTTPNKSVDISGAVVRDVEAYDQTVVLLDDTVPQRYFVGANVEYTEAIQELLTATPGIPSFSITASTTRTPSAMEWEPGTSKLRIISDLLSAINYTSLWFDGNGTLKAGPYVAPSLRDADFKYETDGVSVILADAEQNLDMFQIPNRWVLIVSNPDQPALRAEITNNSPLSPTSTINRGRIITRVVTDVEAPNQAVLNSLAERLRDEDGQVFEHVSFATGLMPFHENADVYDFIHYGLVVSGRFMETKWSMDLTQGAEMKHEARRTVSVLGGFGIGPFGLAPFGA